jgi:hypothetical protein
MPVQEESGRIRGAPVTRQRAAARRYGVRTLIEEIVRSELFQVK